MNSDKLTSNDDDDDDDDDDEDDDDDDDDDHDHDHDHDHDGVAYYESRIHSSAHGSGNFQSLIHTCYI